jgi:uncharacterized protein with ParB-like and HNH nuclease domain
MTIKDYDFLTIGSFLKKNTYFIPDYQREYSWENSQVEDFWMDLKNIKDTRDEEEHFFGQIVVQNDSEDGDKKYIIDGQQRTTTSLIFLSAIREICIKMSKENENFDAQDILDDIRTDYIGKWSKRDDRLKFKVLNNDGEFFKNCIQLRNLKKYDTKPSSKAQKRVLNAFNFLSKQIEDEIKDLNSDEQFEILDCYFDLFINKFKVMYVETTSLEEAFIIFESLNAKGKGLETSDLLKNHIFKTSKGQIDFVKKKWQKMIDNLDEGDTTKFIRYYWNSKEKFTRTQTLYKAMKSKVNTETQSSEMILELEKLSLVYNTISQKNGASIFSDKNLLETINNLKELGASSFYPVVLAMSNKNWEEKDMFIVIKEIEKLIFRNIIIAKNVANKYEIIFAEIAHRISEKNIGAKEVTDKIQKEKISDEEFSNYFTNISSTNKPVIRYIFKQINKLYTSNETIISDSESVHIEHILPESKGKWLISDEDHEKYIYKLGNLTLLGKDYNRSISNKIFDEKKKEYKKSEIHITKKLTEYEKWGIEEIQIRQNELAKDSLKIW